MKRVLVILIAATALSGCGHDVYLRDGTTDTQFIADENACFANAEGQPPAVLGGGGPHDHAYETNIAKARQTIRHCMIARGYSLQPKWPFGPYGESPTAGPDPAKTPLGLRR